MADDPHVQDFYKEAVDHTASTNAGRWQAENNPGYTPPQQHNEDAAAYNTRVGSQESASKK